jgi:hypothetical protein
MNFFKLSCLAACGLFAVAGCAAGDDNASEGSEDELVARPNIELARSRETASVQATLFKLMMTFSRDASFGISSAIDSNSLQMDGIGEVGVRGRAVTCTSSRMEVVGAGGTGFSQVDLFGCTFVRFDKARNGGKLPSVVVPFEGNAPLAGKLFALLEKGEKKGGLGVKRTASHHPGCCDQISTTTYAIGDANATLTCTERSGGLAGITQAECTYTQNDTQ